MVREEPRGTMYTRIKMTVWLQLPHARTNDGKEQRSSHGYGLIRMRYGKKK